MIPDDSAFSHKIKKMIKKESLKQNHGMIRLYEERGVYNFYMRTGAEGSKVEAIADQGPGAGRIDVKALSQQPAGFRGQP